MTRSTLWLRCGSTLRAISAPNSKTLITPREVSAIRRRVDRLLREGLFPMPGDGWPAVPWPPF